MFSSFVIRCIRNMDATLRKGKKIPKPIKKIRIGLFHLINFFLKPFYLRFYQKKIRTLPAGIQIFFVGRNDFGTQLYLLNYVKIWEETRGPTCMIILTGDFPRIQELASQLTPNTILIYPDNWSVLLPIAFFGSNTIQFYTLHAIYPILSNARPDALLLFYLNGNGITEYNPFLDKHYIAHSTKHSLSFLQAYKSVRNQFDYKWHLFEDFYELYSVQEKKQRPIHTNLFSQLKISRPFVLFNINCKNYQDTNSNRRRINYPDRYEALADLLISKGYDVVIQGREEQPHFSPRPGLIDYAKSPFTSVVNDLSLYSNCEFVISSKSGIEIFASICDVPVLGLNYTELLGMQPAKKMRFYPKFLRSLESGRLLSWQEHIASPCFFEIGENNYSNNSIEYVDMSQEDMICALEEFLVLVKCHKWSDYTERQNVFKDALTPLHLELFLVKGVPCDHYLKKTDQELQGKYNP